MDIGTAFSAALTGLLGPLYYKFVGVPLFRRMSRSKSWFVRKVLLFQVGNSYWNIGSTASPKARKPIGDSWSHWS